MERTLPDSLRWRLRHGLVKIPSKAIHGLAVAARSMAGRSGGSSAARRGGELGLGRLYP